MFHELDLCLKLCGIALVDANSIDPEPCGFYAKLCQTMAASARVTSLQRTLRLAKGNRQIGLDVVEVSVDGDLEVAFAFAANVRLCHVLWN